MITVNLYQMFSITIGLVITTFLLLGIFNKPITAHLLAIVWDQAKEIYSLKRDIVRLKSELNKYYELTKYLDQHYPDEFDLPCQCNLCMSYADEDVSDEQ